jgi:glycosyltransferase involved in cell wall biosynthesis
MAAPAARNEVSQGRSLSIAYLTNQYPKVSHTFIRREILELERRGHRIQRLSIRGGGDVFDPADCAEGNRTFVCLDAPKSELVAATAWMQTHRPLAWLKASRLALEMSNASSRGLVAHGAYLVEAALLTRICEQHGVDHVHVHFASNPATVARLMHCLGGPTYSITIHGPDDFDAPRQLSIGPKVADSEFVVAISNFASAQIKRWAAHEDWDKVHIVRCTVGEEFFERSTPIPPSSRTFVNVARLSAAKGQFILIEAMRRLRAEGQDVRLVLAGDGEMRVQIEQAIAAANLNDCVVITGWVDEATVRQHLLDARALVLPSFAEGLPVSIMEALAMQRPVISTTIAGVPELLRSRESGWLVSAGSVPELVDAMREALSMPTSELDRFGKVGSEAVRRLHFTPTQVDVLEELLLRHVGKARSAER